MIITEYFIVCYRSILLFLKKPDIDVKFINDGQLVIS